MPQAEPEAGPWSHWRANLAGKKVQFHDGLPQWGYYRWREIRDHPVAIFVSEGELVALVGPIENPRRMDPEKIWTWVCNKPIDQATYDAVARDGKTFRQSIFRADETST